MRIKTLLTILATVGLLATMGGATGQQNRNQGKGKGLSTPPVPTTQLTEVEKLNIAHMREEEKLARDVYLTFVEMWKDCPIFANIAESEKRHMAAVGLLITKHGLTDPVTDDTVGVFSKPEFTELFLSLTQSGGTSLLDALKVGVQIEKQDIADLQNALSQSDKSDIQWVFGNLLKGSSNHLAAFTRNVESGGTQCLLQGISGNAGKGPQGAGDAMGQDRGRGGKCNGRGNGNGRGCRLGNCGGTCQQGQQQKRDGTCLQTTQTAPAQP